MRRFLVRATYAGVPFGLAMWVVFAQRYGARFSWPFAAAAGVGFGAALAAFVAAQQPRLAPPLEGEHVIRHGPANHFKGIEAVGGWLYLTDTRLFFRSHGFNVQNHELSVPLADLVGVDACRTLGIVPNGLRLSLRDRTERFVVENRRAWVTAIGSARGRAG